MSAVMVCAAGKPFIAAGGGSVAFVQASQSAGYQQAVPEPASGTAGHLQVLLLTWFYVSTDTCTFSGWTAGPRINSAANNVNIQAFWKLRGASAGGPHTPTGVPAARDYLGCILEFSGAHATTPFRNNTTDEGYPSSLPTLTSLSTSMLLIGASNYSSVSQTGYSPGTWTSRVNMGELTSFTAAAPAGATGTITGSGGTNDQQAAMLLEIAAA